MPLERTFEASTVKLNYLDYGSPSAAPVIILHGGAWRWQEYLSLIPDLRQRWRTYALDLRGNGGSGRTFDTHRLRDFVGNSSEFRDGLNRLRCLWDIRSAASSRL